MYSKLKYFFVLLVMLLPFVGIAQTTSFKVHPTQTDANYVAAQDSHFVARNTSIQNNKLFLFIGGTWSNPSNYQSISNFTADLGFDVISLSYKNNIASVAYANSTDTFAMDKYRQHLCYGTPLTIMSVDSLNSVYTRTLKLLQYLDATYPAQNWGQYLLNATTIDWGKIAVGGHSQGAGHAAYFGKKESCDRVLMFGGPNDFSDNFNAPAPWLSSSGLTPLSMNFSYLHLYDNVVDYNKQFSNIQSMGLYPLFDSTLVEGSNPPYSNSRCLYMTDTSGILSAHSKPVGLSTTNNSVWTYMLTAGFPTSLKEIEAQEFFSIYPNPTNGKLTLEIKSNLYNKEYSLQSVMGQTILKGIIPRTNTFHLDVSSVPNGIYFLGMDKVGVKVIKR